MIRESYARRPLPVQPRGGTGDEYRCSFCQIHVGSVRTLLAHEAHCARRTEVEKQRAAVIRRFARKQRRWQVTP